MSDFPGFKRSDLASAVSPAPEVIDYWFSRFQDCYEGKIDTWDYQWAYTVMKDRRLCVRPNMNLVRNIGFDARATHTKSLGNSSHAKAAVEWRPGFEPTFMIPNGLFDYRLMREAYGIVAQKKRPLRSFARKSAKKFLKAFKAIP